MAQPIYFDNTYDGHGLTETLKNAVKHEDGYLFVARSRNVPEDTAILSLILIDTEGVEIRRTEYSPQARTFTFGTLLEHPDSGHVFFNSIGSATDDDLNCHMVRYDDEGIVVWTREYLKDGNDYCYSGIRCSDGGYALYGQGGSGTGDPADNILIRADSEGNEQWRRLYGGSNWEAAYDLIETPDGGFLLLGWTRSFGAGQRDFYLVRTDEQGNELWHETYGGNTDEGGAAILSLLDGNVLLTGSGENPNASGSMGTVYKIDGGGDVIWTKSYTYPGNASNNFHKTIQLQDGSLISTGATGSGGSGGWLIKTNSEGDELWQREYDKSPQTDLFYSVLATPDGGFLLTGQAINVDNFTQDAWLLKVDSIGCQYPNCTVGIEEEERMVMVDVWPNPATDVLNIEKTLSSTTLDITVFDINGKEILKQVQDDGRGTIDVSAWVDGIYILQGIDDKGRSFSLKVVKQ